MTLQFLGTQYDPQYIALSTDIVENFIPGCSNIGARVFLTDIQEWKIVKNDLSLDDYVLPISGGGSGGTVSQGTGGSSAWKVNFGGTAQPVTTDGLTDTQLRATAVPVSGTITATQVASTLPVATIMQNGAVANGNGTSLNVLGYAVAIINIVSAVAMSGGTTINFEASVDDTTWVSILAHQVGSQGTQMTTTAIDGDFRINVAGYKSVRARISLYSAGTITIKGYVTPIAGQTTTVGLSSNNSIIGAVGGNMACIDVTPTLTVHSGYVSGDYVGTSGTAMVFSGASRINNFTGTILSATLIDYALQSVACELWLFDTAITPPVDSAAWSIADVDAARCIGIIPFSQYYTSALNSISFSQGIGIGFKSLPGSTAIYGCLVTRGSPVYASGDLIIRLTILQD